MRREVVLEMTGRFKVAYDDSNPSADTTFEDRASFFYEEHLCKGNLLGWLIERVDECGGCACAHIEIKFVGEATPEHASLLHIGPE